MLAEFIITRHQEGKRLDAVLGEFLPDYALRGRRRLAKGGYVTINGKTATSAQKVRAGDRLGCLVPEIKNKPRSRLLETRGDFYCFFKPPSLHTVALAGKAGESLEDDMPLLLPDKPEMPWLLQRLDYGTSGLVLGAATEKACEDFRHFEKAGECEKFYFALLEGKLERRIVVDRAIDAERRKKSRVLERASERFTVFEPVGYLNPEAMPCPMCESEKTFTLARCVLTAGSRHQIRAHAAWLGFPLFGDSLYGNGKGGDFYLEHYRLDLPENSFRLPFELSIFRNFPGFQFLASSEYK